VPHAYKDTWVYYKETLINTDHLPVVQVFGFPTFPNQAHSRKYLNEFRIRKGENSGSPILQSLNFA